CQRCRELGLEVMTSQRMNDLHATDPAYADPLAHSEFWLDHPEYLLGEKAHSGWHSRGAFNWEIEAVRQQALKLTAEILGRFDSDGHELDFMRFPVFFPAATAPACIPLMNDF